MSKPLSSVLAKLKRRARTSAALGPDAFAALDAHYAGVAQALDRLRVQQQLSQRALALKSEIDQAEISRILSGRTDPRMGTVTRVARALGAELAVVFLPTKRRGAKKTSGGKLAGRSKR